MKRVRTHSPHGKGGGKGPVQKPSVKLVRVAVSAEEALEYQATDVEVVVLCGLVLQFVDEQLQSRVALIAHTDFEKISSFYHFDLHKVERADILSYIQDALERSFTRAVIGQAARFADSLDLETHVLKRMFVQSTLDSDATPSEESRDLSEISCIAVSTDHAVCVYDVLVAEPDYEFMLEHLETAPIRQANAS